MTGGHKTLRTGRLAHASRPVVVSRMAKQTVVTGQKVGPVPRALLT